MIRMFRHQVWLPVLALFAGLPAAAQEDPGKTGIGQVSVTVYHATPKRSEAGTVVEKAVMESLQRETKLNFPSYRKLGSDAQPLFRSYENWAQPLKPSDEVLVRFEARSRRQEEQVRVDLELWLSRKKILKTDAMLRPGKPLYVLGPEWRQGRLIIAVALAPELDPAP